MVRFTNLENPSSFRKMAVAMWRAPDSPVIYGTMAVEMSAAIAWLDKQREGGGPKVTVTHLVARALALALRKYPDMNAKVRFGRIQLRDTVDLFLQVSTDGGADLSGVKIERADEKNVVAIAREIADRAAGIRAGRDASLQKSRNLLRALPSWLVRPFLLIGDFLVNTLHLDLRKAGMPVDAFGSAMITSVGMFGIDVGYAPFIPAARCAMLILVGEVHQRPWVVDGRVEARPAMSLSATFDHRIIDGYHAGLIAGEVKRLLASPELLG
jgi:pyruvate dehydrogenase E2 component (dihydrolipoamide acetyltransferase)